MAFGIDHSSRPPSPATLKQAGVTFVCRYLSTPGNPKNVTAAEAAGLLKAGIAVVVVFETTARRALAGFNAGRVDALSAQAQAAAAGLAGAPIYFAADFDATDQEKPGVASYLRGAVSVLGYDRVGVYGSYYLVRYVEQHDVCRWLWQTYAWSGGLLYRVRAAARMVAGGRHVRRSAHLYQYRNGRQLAGISVDYDRSLASDYGQSPRPHPHPAPEPPPAPVPPPVPPVDPLAGVSSRALLDELATRLRA